MVNIKKTGMIIFMLILSAVLIPTMVFAEESVTPAEQFEFADGVITKFIGTDTNVVIPSEIDGMSVTEIGENAFGYCTGLTDVVIPNSVTSIEEDAFKNCSGLISVIIGDSVNSIGESAFSGCASLTEITISDSVSKIKAMAFYGCVGLKSLTVGKNVTNIEYYAFYGCTGLEKIEWKANNMDYCDNGKGIFFSAGTAGNGIEVIFADGVEKIPRAIFYGDPELTTIPNIRSVTMGESVRSIGESAFSGCTSLTEITIPESVTSIEEDAFNSCTGLEKIEWRAKCVSNFSYDNKIFSGAGTSGNGIEVIFTDEVEEIPGYIFCSSEREYIIPKIRSAEIGNNVTAIKQNIFRDCRELKNVKIGDSVSTIENQAFGGCSSLTKIIIPDSVTSIEWGAFESCTGLTEVTIPDSVTAIDGEVFSGCTGLTQIIIPDSVTSIGWEAFSGCTGLTEVTIPDSVTSIESYAFQYCKELRNIILGNGVTSIGDCAFANCGNLQKIEWRAKAVQEFDDRNLVFSNAGTSGNGIEVVFTDAVESIPKYVFLSYAASFISPYIKSVIIGNGITSIDSRIFAKSTDLISVTIGNGVISIEDGTFSDCTGLTEVIIPDNVTSIGRSAFSGCVGLTEIIIPDSVTSIGDYAFADCTSLEKIEWRAKKTYTGDGVFSNAGTGGNGIEVVFADNVETIGTGWVTGCVALTKVIIPDSVTSIRGGAFGGCTGLTEVTIPDGVTSIGVSAFADCTGLKEIVIPVSVTSIGEGAFEGCIGLKEIIIPGSITDVEEKVFSGCTGLNKMEILDGVKSIEESAFSGCTGLTKVIIPDSVTSIGYEAFSGCTGLKEIIIPSGVTSIGGYAFADCSSLEKIEWRAPDTYVNDSVFSNAGTSGNGIEVIFTDDVKNIPGYVFYSEKSSFVSPNIKSVKIGKNVTNIGTSAFENCAELEHLTVGKASLRVARKTFKNCTGLKKIEWNANIWEYEDDYRMNFCFSYNNENFSGAGIDGNGIELVFGDAVEEIPAYMFGSFSTAYVMPKIKSITIGKNVVSIEQKAFDNCVDLEKIEWKAKHLISYDHFVFSNAGTSGNGIEVIFTNNVESIPYHAFGDDSSSYISPNIKSVIIGENVNRIGNYAFNNCSRLTEITIPDNVITVGEYAFNNCTGLKNVIIGNGVKTIGESAFKNCIHIAEIIIPDGVTYVGDSAFENCVHIAEIIIPDGVTYVGDSAFENCTELTSVIIENGVKTIGESAFKNCIHIAEIIIPDSVTDIGCYAFEECAGITALTIGNGVENVRASAFKNCTGLEKIEWNAKNATVGSSVFANSGTDGNGIEVIFGNGANVIPPNIFYCDSLNYVATNIKSVTISDSVISIKYNAFRNCSQLTMVIGAYNVRKVGGNAFANSGITEISLPKCEQIDGGAFGNCSNLSSVILSKNIREIDKSAFDGCSNLKSITVPYNTEYDGYVSKVYFSGPLPSGISIYGPTVAAPGAVFALNKTVSPYDANNYITYWSSSDTSVAAVHNGIVTCYKEGTVTITVEDGNVYERIYDRITIIVTETKLNMEIYEKELLPSEKTVVYATLESDDYTGEDAVWNVGDSELLKINATGYEKTGEKSYRLWAEIEGIKAGDTTVSVKVDTLSTTMSVTLPAGSVRIDTPCKEGKDYIACEMRKDETPCYITATFTDFNAEKKDFKWSVESKGGSARLGEVLFLKNGVGSNVAGTIVVELYGVTRGEIEIKLESLIDGASDTRKVMVQERIEVKSSNPLNNERNVEVWGGMLLGETRDDEFEPNPVTITFSGKVKKGEGYGYAYLYKKEGNVKKLTKLINESDVSGESLSLLFSDNEYNDIEAETSYYIQIESNALEAVDDEYFFDEIGIEDLSFTTEEGLSYGRRLVVGSNVLDHTFGENFKFKNSSELFGYCSDYTISDESLYDNLFKGATAKEKADILLNMKFEWGGSCFGMSSVLGFFENGIMSPGIIVEGAENVFRDFKNPSVDQYLKDVLHYYQLVQKRCDYSAMGKKGEKGEYSYESTLQKIVERAKTVESNNTFVVCFRFKAGALKKGWHAILACKYMESEDFYEIEMYDSNYNKPILMQIEKDFSNVYLKNNGAEAYEEISEIKYYELTNIYNAVKKPQKFTEITIDETSPCIISLPGGDISFANGEFGGNTDLIKYLDFNMKGNGVSYTVGVAEDNVIVKPTGVNADISVLTTADYFVSVKGNNVTSIDVSATEHRTKIEGNNISYKIHISAASGNCDMLLVEGDEVDSLCLDTEGENVDISADKASTAKITFFKDINESSTDVNISEEGITVLGDGSIKGDAALIYTEDAVNQDGKKLEECLPEEIEKISFSAKATNPLKVDFYLAYYDEEGRLIKLLRKEEDIATIEKPVVMEAGTVLENVRKIKLIAWEKGLIHPLCAVKTYEMPDKTE